jgi:hypothetical protein
MADHGEENRARRDAHRGHRIQRWWRHRGRPLLGRATPRRRAAVRPAAGRTDARLAGGIAELHVWPGGFHGFDLLAPEAALSQDARATRLHWLHCPLA